MHVQNGQLAKRGERIRIWPLTIKRLAKACKNIEEFLHKLAYLNKQ